MKLKQRHVSGLDMHIVIAAMQVLYCGIGLNDFEQTA